MKRALLIASVLLLAAPAAASACSCVMPGKPRKEIRAADAAAYVKVVKRTVTGSSGPYRPGKDVRYRLRVVRDYKRNLPKRITIASETDPGLCGLDLRRGQRVGLLLDRSEGGYGASICSVRSRKHLEEGARGKRAKPGAGASGAGTGCTAAAA